MDSVRFGRALGFGARSAAKAVRMAAEAAAAKKDAPTAPLQSAAAAHSAEPLVQRTARVAGQVRVTQAGVRRGGREFGRAVWGPLVKLSGVLWLELTGVFFGLFLLTAALNIWRLRRDLRDLGVNHQAHVHLLWSVAMAGVFGYFCVSSFVRAGRRGRR